MITDKEREMNQMNPKETTGGKQTNNVFQFALVNNFLTWINFKQKRFWWLRLPVQPETCKEKENEEEKEHKSD